MVHRLKSEACSTKYYRKMVGVIDEKHGVWDIVFLLKFLQKPLC